MNTQYARILLLSDEVCPALYQNYKPGVFDGIDLIISCGDLPARYLEFIATLFRGPVLYVPGNHDEGYLHHPPLGCIDIDDRIYRWKGLNILGLGGSMRYKDGPYQYTQKEMNKRLRKLRFALWRSGGIDILVAHSPAFGLYDGKDICHTGFKAFVTILKKYKPEWFFHGHVHMNYGDFPRKYTFEETTIINGYGRYVVTIPLSGSLKKV